MIYDNFLFTHVRTLEGEKKKYKGCITMEESSALVSVHLRKNIQLERNQVRII